VFEFAAKPAAGSVEVDWAAVDPIAQQPKSSGGPSTNRLRRDSIVSACGTDTDDP
jgi:hypothetical protein